MLGVPELDSMICQQLDLQDLTRCTLVNKRWHIIITPYLWGDLSCLEKFSEARRQAFGRLVLEDYHYHRYQLKLQDEDTQRRVFCKLVQRYDCYEQGRCELQNKKHYLESSKAGSSHRMSALAKYGPWIQWLPNPYALLGYVSKPGPQQQQAGVKQVVEPTKYQLLKHLYGRRCPGAQIRYLKYADKDNKELMELVLPRARNLNITSCRHGKEQFPLFKSSLDPLDRCSAVLENLEICLKIPVMEVGTYSKEEEQMLEDEQQKDWTTLKRLLLQTSGDFSGSKAFWIWLWKRCGQVEQLEIRGTARTIEVITEGMRVHMPNLTGITLGYDSPEAQVIDDDKVAAILSESPKGWKSVELTDKVMYGSATMEALAKHLPTLEVLLLNRCNGSARENLVQVLSSSPRLKTLVSLDNPLHSRNPHYRLNAYLFIDRDPLTGVFNTWACESSLRVLKIKISGIPRPDLKGDAVIEEAYRGQGQEIQGLVYDRLARLTNLETLWLGKGPQEPKKSGGMGTRGLCDCLDMSLENGLHKLAGLKKLKELSVLGMMMKIGVEELEWMTENWPRLRSIYGICRFGTNKKAMKWLRQNHPEIAPAM